MAVFTKIVEILQITLIVVTNIFWFYQFVIAIAALVKVKEKPLQVEKNHRFMIVIPAHNEEAVVGNLVDSVLKIDYPKELFDVYVISDNSTDNTTKVAREHGANVYERNDPTKKTKGYALDWFLTQIVPTFEKDYDAMIVFDADNVVDSEFLYYMNRSLSQGERVVQGYRDIKNPTDSWISGSYAIFYWMMHRFFHLARYNIGLSPLLNGTAFMVSMDLVEEKGWDTITLTEDIEYSLLSVIDGEKLGWQTKAIVYDEQPTEFKQSWTQRERWTAGHLQCLREYTGDLAKATVKRKTMTNFDALLYILGVPMFLVAILLVIVNFVLYFLGQMGVTDLLINLFLYFFTIIIMPLLGAIATVIIEKKSFRKLWKGVLGFPIFMLSWLVINVKSIFKPNLVWEKIEHSVSRSIEEVEEHGGNKD